MALGVHDLDLPDALGVAPGLALERAATRRLLEQPHRAACDALGVGRRHLAVESLRLRVPRYRDVTGDRRRRGLRKSDRQHRREGERSYLSSHGCLLGSIDSYNA